MNSIFNRDESQSGKTTPNHNPTTFIEEISTIHTSLQNAPDLTPKHVTPLFEKLISHTDCCYCHLADDILTNSSIQTITPSLQQLCASGEYELEVHWAKKIMNHGQQANEMLLQFPYYENYTTLAHFEWNALAFYEKQHSPKKVLFVGSGPLPLSGILLQKQFGIQVDYIDCDEQAIQLGKTIHKLCTHTTTSSTFFHNDIREFTAFGGYDAIILGALVGQTEQEKIKIIHHLERYIHPKTALILRSSHGLRQLLYPSIETRILSRFVHLKQVAILHPLGRVINSLVLLEKLDNEDLAQIT